MWHDPVAGPSARQRRMWLSASFSAYVVSVSRQWRNVQDFPQVQHERSTQLVLFAQCFPKDATTIPGESTDILLACSLNEPRGFGEVAHNEKELSLCEEILLKKHELVEVPDI